MKAVTETGRRQEGKGETLGQKSGQLSRWDRDVGLVAGSPSSPVASCFTWQKSFNLCFPNRETKAVTFHREERRMGRVCASTSHTVTVRTSDGSTTLGFRKGAPDHYWQE